MPELAYTLENFVVEHEGVHLTAFVALLPYEKVNFAANPDSFSWNDFNGPILMMSAGTNPSPRHRKRAEAFFAQWKESRAEFEALRQALGPRMNESGDFVGLCPVCGARALITEGADYEHCGNCGWVGGGRLPDDYSVYQGPRHITLEQAQENYRKFRCIEAPDAMPQPKPLIVSGAAVFALNDEWNAPQFPPRPRGKGSRRA